MPGALLNCSLALGEFAAAWADDDELLLTIGNTSTADPALLVAGAGAGVGELVCCVRRAGNLRNADGSSLATDACAPPLAGDWGERMGPRIERLELVSSSLPGAVDVVYGTADEFRIFFTEPTDRGGVPAGWTLSWEALRDGLRWFREGVELQVYTNAEARWVDRSELRVAVISHAPGEPQPCDGALQVPVLPALRLYDAAHLAPRSDATGTLHAHYCQLRDGAAAAGASAAYGWGLADEAALGLPFAEVQANIA
jgi:hypothetical protein